MARRLDTYDMIKHRQKMLNVNPVTDDCKLVKDSSVGVVKCLIVVVKYKGRKIMCASGVFVSGNMLSSVGEMTLRSLIQHSNRDVFISDLRNGETGNICILRDYIEKSLNTAISEKKSVFFGVSNSTMYDKVFSLLGIHSLLKKDGNIYAG